MAEYQIVVWRRHKKTRSIGETFSSYLYVCRHTRGGSRDWDPRHYTRSADRDSFMQVITHSDIAAPVAAVEAADILRCDRHRKTGDRLQYRDYKARAFTQPRRQPYHARIVAFYH